MARELLLLRHGEAKQSAGQPERVRPLRTRGKRGAQRLGVWLWQQAIRPQRILSSPAQRAINTAHKCCKSMGMSVDDIEVQERIYLADLDDLRAVLAESPIDAARVMLVGHNPGLETLLGFLSDAAIAAPEGGGTVLPPGTLARLLLPDDWRALPRGCARLLGLVRPDSLPEGFPYPAPHGDERRDRPAYYYTQSAVIPYRLDARGAAEFLVIGSSGRRHWVVPKGIQDPGLTAQQSAAKEAWEEAGVRGEVQQDRLGRYTVEKWGAQCKVGVYAMRVTEMADEDAWEENHRMRRWLPGKEAAAHLKQPELAGMLLQLAERLEG